MKAIGKPASQTVLGNPHFGNDGVVRFRLQTGQTVQLVYCIAQQAMLGERFAERYVDGEITTPHAEFVDIDLLAVGRGDAVSEAAARWLAENATDLPGGGAGWLHDFDFVYLSGQPPIATGWLCGIGQANALLACLHQWRRTRDARWAELARRAIVPFTRPLDARSGVALQGEDGWWFEEYPLHSPAHILNCHLLCLVALDRAARLLDAPEAQEAFQHGWDALRSRIAYYDRQDWSRYDLAGRFLLFLRLVPSIAGSVAVGMTNLETHDGRPIIRLDAAQDTPCDIPGSRLAGIDWGQVGDFGRKPGRHVPNRQAAHIGAVPEGGTDQNTYLIFEEDLPASRWASGGVRLTMEVCCTPDAELRVEYRDPRVPGMAFRQDSAVPPIAGAGWQTVTFELPPRLIGPPLRQHYHRFHTELLGTLLERHGDDELESIFGRWHRSDLFDFISPEGPAPDLPKTVFVFVNSRCNLRCRMCDVGNDNSEASLKRLMTRRGDNLDLDMFEGALKSLRSNHAEAAVHLVGTEPLLYDRFDALLKRARELDVRTSMTTNGLLLENRAQRIAETGLDQIYLSIDGPPEIHDQIRRREGLFERVSRGVRLLRECCRAAGAPPLELVISFTVCKENHLHIREFLQAVRPMQPDSVVISHLNFVTPEIAESHNRRFPGLRIGPSSVEAWRDCLQMDFLSLFYELEGARRIDWTQVSIIPFCPTPTRLRWYYTRPALPMSRPRCAAPWHCAQVLCDGTVAVLGRCFETTMGDLKTERLPEIWHSTEYERFRNFLREHPYLEPCMRCCGSL